MNYEKVKNFCYEDSYHNSALEEDFVKDDGFIILLTIISQINEYANQLKCIHDVINRLENLRKKSWYKPTTTIEINWFGTRKVGEEEVTLSQAKKLYKETRIKYDTLYELFERSAEIHYKENPKVLIDKYFSY